MEEEDSSDTDGEDSLASRTVVQNLELLATTLRTYLRDEIGIVRDDALKQSAVVESLVSTVRETQLEMRGLKALVETMSEKIDRLTGEPGTPGANASASCTAAAASSIDTTSAAETETDEASNPVPAGEAAEEYLPRTNPAQPAPSTSATATGPAPRHGETDEGMEEG